MQAGPDGPMVKNYGGALNMGKHTKTKTGKYTGPGGETTKGPHAHKDGNTSTSGDPKMGTMTKHMSIKKTMPRMEKGADLSPYDSKPKGRIKKAIKKFVSKVREKRDEKKGCKHGDCGAYA